MITLNTQNPKQLLDSLRSAIKAGHIITWSEVDGYFTHAPAQWVQKAWFMPSVQVGELRFALIKPRNGGVSTEVYAVYHGRFLETMLAHFDKQFSNGVASALPTAADRVAA